MRAFTRTFVIALLTGGMALSLGTAPVHADHANPPGPVHAGSEFGWYRPGRPVDFRFLTVGSEWHIKAEGPANVQAQHGMMTLNTGSYGNVSARLKGPGRVVGRWEIRQRARRYETAYTDYRVVTELIPAADAPYGCGNRNIALENFKLGGNPNLSFYIRNLPNHEFSASRKGKWGAENWHTYGVEVTRKRISWFVDAHVVRTEKRPDALSGVPLTVRFKMEAVEGERMNVSRMQMDWLRIWDLGPSKLSTAAPQTLRGTYADSCGPGSNPNLLRFELF